MRENRNILLVLGMITIVLGMMCMCKRDTGERPFRKIVEEMRSKPIEDRKMEYNLIVQNMKYKGREGRESLREKSLSALIWELDEQEEYESLDYIVEHTDQQEKKLAIWDVIAIRDRSKDLLKKWARENNNVVVLMEYLPDGIERLKRVAADEKATGIDRVLAVCRLADIGDREVRRWLEKMKEDKTRVLLPGQSALHPSEGPGEPIGTYVTECLEKTQQKN